MALNRAVIVKALVAGVITVAQLLPGHVPVALAAPSVDAASRLTAAGFITAPMRTPNLCGLRSVGSVGPGVTGSPAPSPVVDARSAEAFSRHPRPDSRLEELVTSILGSRADHYGVVIKEVTGGTGVEINPDLSFYAASLFKLPVMVETFQQRANGRLGLDDLIVAEWIDVAEDLGTFRGDVGDPYSISELLELMITISDNTSAIMLLRTLNGSSVDRTMKSMGLLDTSVADWELPTTAHDMSLLLEAIVMGQAVDPDASSEMLGLLLRQTWRGRIPAGLPDGVPVGNKTGDWYDAAHDVAIVIAPFGAYVIAVLSDGGGSDATIVELSRRVYEYYEGCLGS